MSSISLEIELGLEMERERESVTHVDDAAPRGSAVDVEAAFPWKHPMTPIKTGEMKHVSEATGSR